MNGDYNSGRTTIPSCSDHLPSRRARQGKQMSKISPITPQLSNKTIKFLLLLPVEVEVFGLFTIRCETISGVTRAQSDWLPPLSHLYRQILNYMNKNFFITREQEHTIQGRRAQSGNDSLNLHALHEKAINIWSNSLKL